MVISPSNGQFKYIDDKYLVGKSDENNDEFDILLFALRDIEEFSIPSNIKIISSCAFDCCRKLTKVEIPTNSNLQTIEEYAFFGSLIKEIYFPASLKKLKEKWCSGTQNLTKITISPSNGQFKYIDDKYLVGKSDENNDEFDILLFVRRDIEEFSIPSNIKIISSCAFHCCQKLTKVEIPTNSNLQIIESYAFYNTNINYIFIPSKVYKICERAFKRCPNLSKVEIPTNSDLQIIESYAFYSTNINYIFIPSKVSKIYESAFSYCRNLNKVDIPENSNLKTIERYAFNSTNISEFFIPSKVSKICKETFSHCLNLNKVVIPSNSNLQTIESFAFYDSNIKEIIFPESLKELKVKWCYSTFKLSIIRISPSNGQFKYIENKYLVGKSDDNNDEFDTLLFASRDIEDLTIPSNIKIISPYAFQYCKKLTKVEIPSNSNLQTIESCAFSTTNIKEIFIPSNVSKICKDAFVDCKNLTKIEIPTNSNLQIIESGAFARTKIKTIFVPSKVTKICNCVFYDCKDLQIIEISEGSNLESFPLSDLYNNPKLIIMIPSSL